MPRVKSSAISVGTAALVFAIMAGNTHATSGALSLQTQAIPIPEWQTAAGGKMSFEVASIHLSKSDTSSPPTFPMSPDDSYRPTGGRLKAEFPVTTYISFAYKLTLTPDQRQALLSRLPKWVPTDKYVLEAKAPVDNPTKDQMRLMMQALLADRFKLAVHFEMQDTAVLALTVANAGKLGPQLHPHAEGPPCDVPAASAKTPLFPPACDILELDRKDRMAVAASRNNTMEYIGSWLSTNLGRPVVDQTGLRGRYDFKLQWTPQVSDPIRPDTTPGDVVDDQAPTFLQAIREQLGLKLESTRAPLRVIVIDHIERPTEN